MNPLLMWVLMALVLANLQGCGVYLWALRESQTPEWQARDRQTQQDAAMRDVRRILKEHRK